MSLLRSGTGHEIAQVQDPRGPIYAGQDREGFIQYYSTISNEEQTR